METPDRGEWAGQGELVVLAPAGKEVLAVHPLRASSTVLPPVDEARVSCRGEAVWCPEIRLTGTEVRLPVFAAMQVSGQIIGAAEPPVTGIVQAVVAETREARAPVELRQVLVLQEGRFSFRAPSRKLDLRLAFDGSAPVYRWDVGPSAGGDSEAGASDTDSNADSGAHRGPDAGPLQPIPLVQLQPIRLRPGGSLGGWVRRAEDELPLASATVVATPLVGSGEGAPLHRSTAAADSRGFFQVFGLEAGTYRVEVSAEGRAPRVLEAVEVAASSETQLGVLELGPPLEIRVQVQPPRHPSGEPWRLAFFPRDRRPGEEPRVVPVKDDGTAEVRGLHPADYGVRVQSSSGENLLAEEYALFIDQQLVLEVPIVAVSGSVRLGDDPLRASLKLQGGTADRVDLESDEEGRFSGWMRRPERRWLMATVRWDQAGEPLERTVEVTPEGDEDAVELEIVLPAGEIRGEVVDGRGRPQRDLRVTALPEDAATRFREVVSRTDDRGRFRLQGLDSGTWLVQAGGGGPRASEVLRLELAEDTTLGDVQLVVGESRPVTVRVTAMGAPVPDAAVALEVPGSRPASLDRRTDARGEAELRVPDGADRAVLTVLAPSQVLWSGCVSLRGETVTLDLPAATAGTLSLRLTGGQDLPPLLGGQQVLLTGDGGFLPLGVLLNWNRLRGADSSIVREGPSVVHLVRLPALAAGDYALTWTGAPAWQLAHLTCTGSLSPTVDWQTLPPNGQVELSMDVDRVLQEAVEAADR